MDLVSRVLSRRLVPVGLLLGAISSIFSLITGIERQERTGERSSTGVPVLQYPQIQQEHRFQLQGGSPTSTS